MNPPLMEVFLQLHFDPMHYPEDRLQYFYRINQDLLPQSKQAEKPTVAWFLSADHGDSLLIASESFELRSNRRISFPRLRSGWTKLLDSFLDIFGISVLKQVSLNYLNEIPLEDLRSFHNYLNIAFEMPAALKERFEFFRSEFIYKYDFGQIKVWLQPDWDEQMENYCIQLNLESLHLGPLGTEELFPKIQLLHEGIKDVFRQVLAQDYIRQLPQ